ncbi:2-methylcitrate dehydratase [Saccharomonospora sp. CUA-673]|uniref:MmgE/PrpD family protein n=1 Tax=Saccharomonospora sp. CUA-673 TaxID=1904969 RepID=UPI00095FEB76|nr:MmgE/PrpD family protein [Saccharomonospora sp. CUA-673]OLT45270.1 2-methylcitrate dehydratase [Saccharomonospora sp. CUA-673]
MITELAEWAAGYRPTEADARVARTALVDTVAVALAAEDDPIVGITAELPGPARWGAIGHVLDFDDVHLPSTSHVSVVCVTAALAAGGGERDYLVGAGVMARLGAALGWEHYAAGWHATCTAGAPAAAVAAGSAMGLDAEGLTRAMALAVPGAGGVRRSFGTSGKSLQVGFAVEAGVRAARLAAAGASADPGAVEQWFSLVRGSGTVDVAGGAVPAGLAVKLHPCCYALQRPIGAARELHARGVRAADVDRLTVTTPAGAMAPLLHHDPQTGLEGKFSMEYAVAATLLDAFPELRTFTDEAVRRPEARRLVERTELELHDGGTDLLAGDVAITASLVGGGRETARLRIPPGHPDAPPSEAELAAKVTACAGPERADDVMHLDWPGAADLLRSRFG